MGRILLLISSSSSSSDQDSLQEESADNRSVEISSDESDSSSDKEMVEDRNIELTTLSPAGTTPARADFSPFQLVILHGARNRNHL